MPRLRYSNRAVRDLRAILQYVTQASGSLATGLAFVTKLRTRCVEIASIPGHMGRPRYELLPDLRSVAFRGYVIFFRYQQNVFEVVSIIEGHRDIDANFEADGDE